MKILVVKYDNGYAATLTERVPDPNSKDPNAKVEHQIKRVFESRDAMFTFLQEKL